MSDHVEMFEDHAKRLDDRGDMELENQMVALVDEARKSKKRKENFSRVADDDCFVTKLERDYKRVILALSKPSYLLAVGSNNVRTENRRILQNLLQKLVGQHNWTEASGVLSVLLKATCKESCPTTNRFKYLVSMELLKHIAGDNVNLTAISRIYDTWMTRIGVNVSSKRKRTGCSREDSFVVRLESILFRLKEGNAEGESQNARSLMQEPEFESHSIFNMIIGLIFYQLWYSSLPKNLQWRDSDEVHSPTDVDMSVTHSQSEMSAARMSYEVEHSGGHDAVFSDESNESNTFVQYNSETSVMNYKKVSLGAEADICRNVVPLEYYFNAQTENPPLDVKPQAFYVNSAENEESLGNDGGHIPFVPNFSVLGSLDAWLLPLRTKNWELNSIFLSDEYKYAVEYLRKAVYSMPPVLAALLPLIQLLLIGCKDKDALHELEQFCGVCSAALPVRMKADLLHSLDPKDTVMLSSCFEDTLKRDPTCSRSLERLISLYEKGDYSPESLLEMIALHLDAVFVEYSTWKVFASCFLKVAECEEDRMSLCLHGNKTGQNEWNSVSYERLPTLFMRGKSGKDWRLRCKWWLVRHFSRSMLESEIAAGDMQLLTYKAACASHMYGPDFEYVAKACDCLETDCDLFMFLEEQMENSIGLNLFFEQKH